MIRVIALLIVKFFLGAESGASFSWSSKWQDKKAWFSEVPEAVDALILAFLAVSAWGFLFDLSALHAIGYGNYHLGLSFGLLLFPVFALISYVGIQSATWMFLRWDDGGENPNTKRTSTTKPLVDLVASRFGWGLGDEGYSWVAATIKGTIITLPLCGLGGLFFAFGYEIGSWFKRKGRSKYLPGFISAHGVSEGMSLALVGLYYVLMLYVFKLIGS